MIVTSSTGPTTFNLASSWPPPLMGLSAMILLSVKYPSPLLRTAIRSIEPILFRTRIPSSSMYWMKIRPDGNSSHSRSSYPSGSSSVDLIDPKSPTARIRFVASAIAKDAGSSTAAASMFAMVYVADELTRSRRVINWHPEDSYEGIFPGVHPTHGVAVSSLQIPPLPHKSASLGLCLHMDSNIRWKPITGPVERSSAA